MILPAEGWPPCPACARCLPHVPLGCDQREVDSGEQAGWSAVSRWLRGGVRRSSLSLILTVAVVAALVTAAILTVRTAGCDDPGRLVARSDGTVQVQGGCVAAGDLVVPGAPLSTVPHVVPPNDRP